MLEGDLLYSGISFCWSEKTVCCVSGQQLSPSNLTSACAMGLAKKNYCPRHCYAWPQGILAPGDSEKRWWYFAAWGYVMFLVVLALLTLPQGQPPTCSMSKELLFNFISYWGSFGLVFVTRTNLNTVCAACLAYRPSCCPSNILIHLLFMCLRNCALWSTHTFEFSLFQFFGNYPFLVGKSTDYQDHKI